MPIIASILLLACANVSLAAEGSLVRSSGDNFESYSANAFAGPSAPGATKYLHVEGSVKGADNGALFKELEDAFDAPLRQKPTFALFSDVAQVDGVGHVVLNLIVEPASPSNAAALDAYVSRLSARGFHGLPVVFQEAARIDLSVSLQIGMYTESNDDAFSMHYETNAQSSYPSIAAWLAAYNPMGFGVIAKDHRAFVDFVRGFVGDPQKFKDIQERVLPANNMVELVTRTSVELPGGAVAGPLMDTGPFLPFSFVRNCFDSRLENGMCSGVPARAAGRALPSLIGSRFPLHPLWD
jgi:hypothetical protein